MPTVVRKRLADGTIAEYTYAFRGGPRVPVPRSHPDFEERWQEAVAAHKEKSGKAVAAARVRGAWARFGGGNDPPVEVTALASKLVQNARYRSARRKMDCNLTVPAVLDLLLTQDLRCAVSGLPFDASFNIEAEFSRNPFGASLDRIDNRKGYVQGNVRIVVSAVNYAVNEWGMDAYLRICRSVVEKAAQSLPS